MKRLALAFAGLMLLSSPAFGQCRSGGFVCAPHVVHQDAVIVTPAVVAAATVIEVPVPTFVFQVLTAYQPPAVAVPTAPAASFAAPPAAVAAKTPDLSDEQLERLADKLAARLGRSPAASALPVAADDARDASPDQARVERMRDAAANYFGSNCRSCHGDANAKGDFRLFAGNTIDPRKASDNSPVPWSAVLAKLDTDGGQHAPAMPPGARADRSKWADTDTLGYVRLLAGQPR